MTAYGTRLNFGAYGPSAVNLPATPAPLSYADSLRFFNSSDRSNLSFGLGSPSTNIMEMGVSPVTTGMPQMSESTITGALAGATPDVDTSKLADQTGGTGFSWGGALDGFKTLASVLGSFGQIYSGIQMNKIAKEQLAFNKASYAENLANQKSTYNASSEARARSAGVQNNWSDAEVEALIAKRKL